jgi:YHS domain-containing protein
MNGLLWLLVLAGFFYFMMRWGCGAHAVHGHGGGGGHEGHGPAGGEPGHGEHGAPGSLKDPVCGMSVDANAEYRSTYNGREYRFCSARCREQFDAEPARYTA